MARLKMERGQDNPILRTPSAVVKKIDKKLLKFIEDMKETMELEHGVGLAAPQVGVNLRVVVCKFNYDTPHELVVGMINPLIVSKSATMDLNEEGCLSLPKRFDSIARHSAVTVKFLDTKGKQQILKLKNFNARVVQHEVDHVDAHLYIDHINDPETIRLKMEEK